MTERTRTGASYLSRVLRVLFPSFPAGLGPMIDPLNDRPPSPEMRRGMGMAEVPASQTIEVVSISIDLAPQASDAVLGSLEAALAGLGARRIWVERRGAALVVMAELPADLPRAELPLGTWRTTPRVSPLHERG